MEAVTPRVSVVMINWNRREIVRQVLTNFKRQTYPNFEIILVDNGSTDGAPEMVAKEFPGVTLIRLNENAGVRGYNIAFDRASGAFIVIVDNDSFLEDEGIAKMVRKFQQYPLLGALGCKVFYYYSGELHHWHPSVRADDPTGRGFPAPLFNGCAAAARSSVLKEVGFYPDEFFLYENERDLCTRIINSGYEVRYFTDIMAYHMVSPEKGRSERLVFYATRNLIWYFWKYFPVRIALARTAYITAGSFVYAALKLKPRMYLRPIVAAFSGLPKILRLRKPIKKESIAKVLY
jgi:GT2 family glycosyltransferase